MSTRAEQVEALTRFGDNDDLVCLLGEVGAQKIRDAAATLTSYGELRERLSAYAFELETSGDQEEAETKRAIGAALKALLKETGDGV